jgi:ATP-binding cassette subfamily C (CFTR/MRP) protein 1
MSPGVASALPTSPSDEWRAGFFSKLTWSWLGPLLQVGYTRPLTFDDLGALDPQDASHALADRMEAMLAAQSGSLRFDERLWRVLFRIEWRNMGLAGLGKGVGDLTAFVGPLALTGIVHFCVLKGEGKSDAVWPADKPGMEMGYWWFLAAFFSALFQNWALHQHHHFCMRAGMHVKTALGQLVFRKSLRVTASIKASFGAGNIQNLSSVDANAVGLVFWFIHYAWAAPMQIAICVAMLYAQLGPSAFVGLAVTMALLPMQGSLAGRIARASKSTMQYSDARVKLINEILSSIRVLKFMAWEGAFSKRVSAARVQELKYKRVVANVNALNTTLMDVGPLFVALLTFLTYAFTSSSPLTAGQAFTALTLYQILRLPLMVMPMLVGAIGSARVAADRLSAFLDAPEQREYRELLPVVPEGSKGYAVTLTNATLTWGTDASVSPAPDLTPFALQHVSLRVPAGKLTTVVGAVGSGKSSLLSAILGEMELSFGTVSVSVRAPVDGTMGAIAYCGQQPWIVNASLRDNIVFGSPWDEKRYTAAVFACALEQDLAMLPAGDATEIGERGVTLSGGQKARVALARAVYSSAPIVLLDDVLSAVDAHVAGHLWEHALTGPLGLRGRTVVLVSHQLQFLAQSHLVIVLAGGRAVQVGTYAALLGAPPGAAGNALATMMAARQRVDAELQRVQRSGEDASVSSPVAADAAVAKGAKAVPSADEAVVKKAAPSVGPRTTTDEDRNTGSVPNAVYYGYARALGPVVLPVLLLALLLANAARVGTDVWLGFWAVDSFGATTAYYVGVYAGITLASALISLLQSLAWASGGIHAGLRAHSDMLARLLRARTSFFDATPAGRILNRFSTDVAIVDKDLPTSMATYTKVLTSIVATVVVQAVILPFTLVAAVPVSLTYAAVGMYYRASAREVKRMDAISKSPVYAHLSETLVGLPSIRAYAVTEGFAATAETRLDAHNCANWKVNLLNRWLGLRLDALGALLVGGVCLVSVLTAGSAPAGLVGLSIAYAMSLTGSLNWLVRSSTEAETYLASMERMQSYSVGDAVPVEKDAVVLSARPPTEWPAAGAVRFESLSVRYRPELPLVLNNVSVDVPAGTSVGVCGRTGSGKSSLMLALFRIMEPCEGEGGGTTGRVCIDGLDIHAMGLADLRRKLSIIPQDPVLFGASVRYNLHPVAEEEGGEGVDDAAMWAVLKQVQLDAAVTAMGGLDAAIAEGGENLSVGQRQLLCIARALLRRSRVLVLDEATASVDVATDALVQSMLRTSFVGCTVFVIAHRIDTVLGCDRVLVMDKGSVAEFDAPAALLARPESLFAALVRSSAQAGAGEAQM